MKKNSLTLIIMIALMFGIKMMVYADEYTVYTDEESFLAALSEKTTVDFDTYPDGTPIPTGYTHTGEFTGFAFSGDEFAELGVEFSSPVDAILSTVSTIDHSPIDLFVSPPNSLTPGTPPYVGGDDNHDSLDIVFTSPVTAAGLILIDSDNSSLTESIAFFNQNGNAIAILELPSDPPHSYLFIGITSDVPIGSIAIAEDADDGDDVSYDNLTFGTAKAIYGHVTDCQTGDLIKWALIIAIQKPTKVRTLTNREGYYEISDLEPGEWWLIGFKRGYKLHIAKVKVPTRHDFCMESK